MVCPYWVSATWWPQLIKLKVPKTPCLVIKTFLRDVNKLQRELDATAKMAPNFYVVLRQVLESKEVQDELVTDFLEQNPSKEV